MDDNTNNHLETAREEAKCENRIVEPMDSTESEELNTNGNWSELPELPLEKIYSFLARSDQANMSLVCRKWSAGYGSPSVWKNFRFALTARMLSRENCPVMKFVPKYCSMFRHVHIDYGSLSIVPLDLFLIYIWCQRLVIFLEYLITNSQLISVCICNLIFCFKRIDSHNSAKIKKTLASFLGTQRHLKSIELFNFSTYLQDYEQILEDLHENSRKSITHFSIIGLNYASYSENMEPNRTVEESFLSIINFPNLEALGIHYSNIFVNTFSCQSAAMKTFKKLKKLMTIILYYDRDSDINNHRRLTSADWQFLKKLCPRLRVILDFTTFRSPLREIEFIIVPDMPIVFLNLRHFESTSSVINAPPLEIELLLAFILQSTVTSHLEDFSIKWLFPITDLASTFIPFLKALKKLKYFYLFITYPANGIDLLMESWMENKPESLQEVYICIDGVENEHDYNILQKLTTDSISRLKLVGLKVMFNILKKTL